MNTASELIASAQRIDLWLAFHDEIDSGLHAGMRALLSPAERQQEIRFHFAEDRTRHLITRALVRTVLTRYVPEVAAEDWEFSSNEFGRPELANAPAAAHGLSFNISHTRGLIALAVTRHRQLGVDVENVRAREAALGIAEHFFAPEEVAELRGLRPELRQERFFEYWTFKESYIKARGQGLSIPLDQFGFDYPAAGRVRLSTKAALGDDAGHWCFWQFRPSAQHLLALCAGRHPCGSPEFSIRKSIPTLAEQPLAARWEKSSLS